MFGFLVSTIISLVSGNGTGWTTQTERDDFAAALKASGHTEADLNGSGNWNRHLQAMDAPQPKEWQSDSNKETYAE